MADTSFLLSNIQKRKGGFMEELKTRLEFAHHQNTAGMLGAYYHFNHDHPSNGWFVPGL